METETNGKKKEKYKYISLYIFMMSLKYDPGIPVSVRILVGSYGNPYYPILHIFFFVLLCN